VPYEEVTQMPWYRVFVSRWAGREHTAYAVVEIQAADEVEARRIAELTMRCDGDIEWTRTSPDEWDRESVDRIELLDDEEGEQGVRDDLRQIRDDLDAILRRVAPGTRADVQQLRNDLDALLQVADDGGTP
jgi:hypothetical protein